MAKAMNDVSRRALIGSIAVLPAAVVSTAVPASIQTASSDLPTDPIFAAIERHRRAAEEWSSVMREHEDLYDLIPQERRVGGVGEICAADDPRWISACERYGATFDAMEEAATEL